MVWNCGALPPQPDPAASAGDAQSCGAMLPTASTWLGGGSSCGGASLHHKCGDAWGQGLHAWKPQPGSCWESKSVNPTKGIHRNGSPHACRIPAESLERRVFTSGEKKEREWKRTKREGKQIASAGFAHRVWTFLLWLGSSEASGTAFPLELKSRNAPVTNWVVLCASNPTVNMDKTHSSTQMCLWVPQLELEFKWGYVASSVN